MSQDIYLLHVEDNPDDIALTRLAFEENHFPFRTVVISDGAKALDFLFARGEFSTRDKRETPALILLDLNLPKVHGLEVLRQLKEDPLLKNILVVILTSSLEEKDQRVARQLGTNLYVQKPIAFDDFAAVVRQLADMMSALVQK